MNRAAPRTAGGWTRLRRPFPLLCLLASALWLALATGCANFPFGRGPGQTFVQTKPAALPARVLGNYFIVEAEQIDGTVRRFLVDTGSTATFVSQNLAKAIGQRERDAAKRTVPVRSANNGEITLETVTLKRLQLGEAKFDRVAALVYDFEELSAHLGLTIDGLIGFPVFRNTLLTLDYPHAQLVIAPHQPGAALPRSAGRVAVIAFNNEQGTPFIPVQLGNESFVVLVDSGSDGGLQLNPVGLHPRFAFGPRAGTLVSSISGDRAQQVGRLGQNLLLGTHVVEQPVVDVTDQLSSIGGELLRHFAVTFDQRRNYATFTRDTDGPVRIEPRRSTGLSFSRAAAYWRVLRIVPDTPTTQLGLQPGDLVVRINGEPVAGWSYERYAALLASAAKVTYTFLTGTREYDVEIPVFELVP
ncbi:aspartyl protease family protein [Oleiharenicola sp. Vm1]|uniref:aspartyl protease family protein n=1 Tax=Oleiharenicola sp. Vm1 TaxID=3398393 RepID=UPI0039F5AE4E